MKIAWSLASNASKEKLGQKQIKKYCGGMPVGAIYLDSGKFNNKESYYSYYVAVCGNKCFAPRL